MLTQTPAREYQAIFFKTSQQCFGSAYIFIWIQIHVRIRHHFYPDPDQFKFSILSFLGLKIVAQPPSRLSPAPGPAQSILQGGSKLSLLLQNRFCRDIVSHIVQVWILERRVQYQVVTTNYIVDPVLIFIRIRPGLPLPVGTCMLNKCQYYL